MHFYTYTPHCAHSACGAPSHRLSPAHRAARNMCLLSSEHPSLGPCGDPRARCCLDANTPTVYDPWVRRLCVAPRVAERAPPNGTGKRDTRSGERHATIRAHATPHQPRPALRLLTARPPALRPPPSSRCRWPSEPPCACLHTSQGGTFDE
eukprot:386850-Prymnesium_polylepis.1